MLITTLCPPPFPFLPFPAQPGTALGPVDPGLLEISIEKSNKIEVLYVLASLLGGPLRCTVQAQLLGYGILDTLMAALDMLRWEPGCDAPEESGPANGIHGPGCMCGTGYSAFKGQLLRTFSALASYCIVSSLLSEHCFWL